MGKQTLLFTLNKIHIVKFEFNNRILTHAYAPIFTKYRFASHCPQLLYFVFQQRVEEAIRELESAVANKLESVDVATKLNRVLDTIVRYPNYIDLGKFIFLQVWNIQAKVQNTLEGKKNLLIWYKMFHWFFIFI